MSINPERIIKRLSRQIPKLYKEFPNITTIFISLKECDSIRLSVDIDEPTKLTYHVVMYFEIDPKYCRDFKYRMMDLKRLIRNKLKEDGRKIIIAKGLMWENDINNTDNIISTVKSDQIAQANDFMYCEQLINKYPENTELTINNLTLKII